MFQTLLAIFQSVFSVIAMLMGIIAVTIVLYQWIAAEFLGKPLRMNGADRPIDWPARGFLALFAFIFGCLGVWGAWLFSNDWVSQSLAQSLPSIPLWAIAFFIPTIWFAITSLLNRSAGWYELRQKFSPPTETAHFTRKLNWAVMGQSVTYKNTVTISVYQTGLGIGQSRLFGPFIGTILVPWANIFVEAFEGSASKLIRLSFHPLKRASLTLAEDIWLEIEQHRPTSTL